jgi:hypothetical protein
MLNNLGYYGFQDIYMLGSSVCELEDWHHIGTFGTSLTMYRKGYKRRLVDTEGNIVLEYTIE